MTLGQSPSDDAPAPLEEGRISTTSFHSPKLTKHRSVIVCEGAPDSRAPKHLFQSPECEAVDAQLQGAEGWVKLSMMVNSQGRPFEIAVTESTGNPLFERAALSRAASLEFQPASENGQPIESAFEYKYVYVAPGATGANPQFIQNFQAFQAAAAAQDRAAADQAMKAFKITNLYEDAHMGVATYQYAKLWGTDAEQRAGLARAIANYDRGQYLAPELHQHILFALFDLEVKDHLYVEANLTAGRLQKLNLDAKSAQALVSIVDQIKKIQTDGSSYDVEGQIHDSGYDSWHASLYKHHFRISIQQGNLSVVKLRCQKDFVTFDFRPDFQYEYSNKTGVCNIELLGAPGTQFTLTQFGDD